jgi:hypothetical protein
LPPPWLRAPRQRRHKRLEAQQVDFPARWQLVEHRPQRSPQPLGPFEEELERLLRLLELFEVRQVAAGLLNVP